MHTIDMLTFRGYSTPKAKIQLSQPESPLRKAENFTLRKRVVKFVSGFFLSKQKNPSSQEAVLSSQSSVESIWEQKASEIQRGRKVLIDLCDKPPGSVFKASIDPKLNPSKEEPLSSVFWAFMETGGVFFENGTIILTDSNQERINRIWEHLETVGYPRISSHLGKVPKRGTRGFDFTTPLLPHFRMHLLFIGFKGKDGALQILFKAERAENKGLIQAARHGVHYITKAGRRILTGESQKDGDRKERRDSKLIKPFLKFAKKLSHIQKGSKIPFPKKAELKIWGVQSMHSYLEKIKPSMKEWSSNSNYSSLSQEYEQLTRTIADLGADPERRFGAEIRVSVERYLRGK